MSTEIRFYHMERSTLDQVLPQIVLKAVEKGHRLLVRVANTKELKHLSELLWRFDEDSFLPHATIKDSYPEKQIVLLTTEAANQNNADVLILTGGAARQESDADFALICDIFDGVKEPELLAARNRWKTLKDQDGLNLSYFQQNDRGGWEKKA